MAMYILTMSLIASCCMYYIVLLTSQVVAIIADHSVGSADRMYSKGCRVDNGTHGVKAYCKRLGLESIPRDLPLNTISLDASYNQITALKNDSFQSLRQLTILNVRNNHISDLQVGTFLPLTNLRTLDLSGNKLIHLQHNIFDSNHLLLQLALSRNNFSSVPTDALATCPQMQRISLADNSIQIVDFTAFVNSSKISVIDMPRNMISSMQASDFKPLQSYSLNILNLAHNRLHSLPARLFLYLYKVNQLNLETNRLYNLNLSSLLGNANIGELLLYGCRIRNIIPLDNSSYSNKTFPKIDLLEMSGNIIAYIPQYAFWGLQQTRTLKIIGNKITTTFVDSFCGLDSLIHLDISHNRIDSLHYGMFSCNPDLQELIISRNEIVRINPTSFHGLSALRLLDLSNNVLRRTDDRQTWSNPQLNSLDISHNQFSKLNQELFFGDLSNLKILDVSYNVIKTYSVRTFHNVPSLQELYLISEDVQFLDQVFSQMKNLIKLDLSYADTSLNSTHQFTQTASLQVLRMCQNNLHGADLFDNITRSSLFDGLVSLKKLNLHGNLLNGLEPGVFRPLTKLYELDLSKASIAAIKPGVFEGLTSLRSLYLDDNYIIETPAKLFSGLDYLGALYFRNTRLQVLDKNLFVQTPHLHKLLLSGNRLSEVHRDTFFPTNNTLLIDVSANPFSCTCALSWFRAWLHTSDIEFLNPNKTLCSSTSLKAVVDKPVLMFNPADFCSVNILLVTGLSLCAFFVGLLCVVAYNKRWWLNHKLFLLKLAIIGYEEMAEDFNADNYLFHLNLMFHDEEEEWVNQFMKPALEGRMPHLQNIVYGDNDLHLGMFYIDAIYDAIENSFKTVLLISNQSIGDAWCMTKLRMALEHVNESGLDKVILIFVEDIEDENLPYLVRLFLSRNKPYMLWTDDEDGQELFWAQFERSMRANKAINNAIPL